MAGGSGRNRHEQGRNVVREGARDGSRDKARRIRNEGERGVNEGRARGEAGRETKSQE